MSRNLEPAFDALQFKQKAQARVQEMLDGLSPEEEIRVLADAAASGPSGRQCTRSQPAKPVPDPSSAAGERCAPV
jgi:hypothetical protein